ncbi:trypsin-like peptidase domain-containing protein [Streptomyces vilmorinianum]|uniref:VMAP-C domain-containing protein n=1 Tax=Streptomyces vilmorinianum TaxID=3051092 RepID=UPI0010FB0F22|nr:trypsin-like peptidase domain-containing protein [Streptomyces vilmorinianum]
MSALDALVRPALVRISDPADGYERGGDRYWGTGFFIAPAWVLTCAHVVAKGGSAVWRHERAVGVTWQGGSATGQVVLAKPHPDPPEREPDRWDFPDIALVHVPEARDVSCVRLSERPPVITRPIDVSLHGWSLQAGGLGIRQAVGEAHGADGGALLLRWTLPVEGLSGGPVVDRNRGAVIGINKGRGRDEGAAVPITSLRELHDVPGGEILHEVMRDHDRHHLARYRRLSGAPDWTREQIRLRPPTTRGVGPGRRIQLYGRLAELPPPAGPGDVLHLVDEVKRRVLHEDFQSVLEADPRTWREGVGLLHELRDPAQEAIEDLGLNAVFLYAAQVVRHTLELHGESPAVRSLADWIEDEAVEAHPVIQEEIAGLLAPDGDGATPGHATAGEAPAGLPRAGQAHADQAPAGQAHEDQAPADQAHEDQAHEDQAHEDQAHEDQAHEDQAHEGQIPAGPPDTTAVRERGARADVIVRVDAVPYSSRYHWQVSLLFDGRTISPLHDAKTGAAREELAAALCAPLAEALRHGDSGGRLAAVEAWLPRELFDLPLDTWCPSADGRLVDEHALTLGQRRIVVIRDVARRSRPASPEWRDRWQAAKEGPLKAIPLRAEAPGAGPDAHTPHLRRETPKQALVRLLDAENGSVPVFCGPVGSGEGFRAMAAALTAGHPIALWRHSAHQHTDCAEFHEKAGLLLAEAGRAEGLHRPIRTLRIRAGDEEADPRDRAADAWAENVSVLLDPPDRPPLVDEPLYVPPLLGEEDP